MRRLAAIAGSFPRPFWALWAGTLVNRTGEMVLPFLPLFLVAERGLGVEQATVAVSLYGGGSLLGGVVGGTLSDRVGRRAVLLLSLVGGAACLIAVALVQPFALLAPTVFACGLLSEMYRPAVSAAVSDLVPGDDQPRAYALIYWAINLGVAIGPVLGGLLAEWTFTALFVVDGVTMLVYAAVVVVAVPETRPDVPPPAADAPRVRRADALRGALADGPLVGLALAMLGVGLGFVQLFSTLPLAMDADGLRPLDYGLTISINGGLIVLLSLPVSTWVGRRIGGLAPALGVALIGVGLAVTAPAHTLAGYAVGAVLWTLGEMAFLPIVPTLVSRLAPPAWRGTYQGVYHGAWGLAKTLGPALGGLVFARLGPAWVWGGASALAFAASVGMVALRPAFRRRLGLDAG